MDPSVERIEQNDRRHAECFRIAFFRRIGKLDPCDLACGNDAFGNLGAVFFTGKLVLACKLLDLFLFLHLVFAVEVYEVDHELAEDRIKLRAEALDKFLSYDLLGDHITVASSRSHGVVSVCYGDDPCDLGNVIALETFGIASAVITFVMRLGTDGKIRGFADRGEDLRTDVRMFFYDLVLFIRELVLLVEDRS